MCDSIEVLFNVNDRILGAAEASRREQFTNSFKDAPKAVSPLTDAIYKMSPEYGAGNSLTGVIVSLNPPACTIGNNIAPQNLVLTSSNMALLFLQNYLLERGFPEKMTDIFSIERSELMSVSLTYLIDCGSHEGALAKHRELFARGETLKKPKKGSKYSPVRSVGRSDEFTSYYDGRGFQIKCYIKSGPTPKSFCQFRSEKVKNGMYAIGSRLLRVEFDAKRSWLVANGLSTPSAFYESRRNNTYSTCFNVIRKYFRMDDKFRSRRPKDIDLDRLPSVEREIVELHLDGKDWRSHQIFDGKSTSTQSKIRRKIFDSLRLDLNIPWQEQCTRLNSSLPNLMQYTKRYCPSSQVRAHSYVFRNVNDKLAKLRSLVTAKIKEQGDTEDLDLD